MMQATREILLAGKVSYDDFAAFINAYKIPSGVIALMLLERLPRSKIKPEERQDLLVFSKWNKETEVAGCTSGRIFYEQGELRWERQQAYIQVVYIGDRVYRPELNKSKEVALEDYERTIRSYFLFGKRLSEKQRERIGPATQSGDFAEVRIPRLLRYPVLESINDAERIQLVICEYRDRMTGTTIAYRFEKLVPFHPGQKEVQL